MKILICGMPRSMTTWAFNVIRQLLAQKNIQTIWIDPTAVHAETAFINSEVDILAKCHHYNKELANNADLIIYSYRDIRTAAVSYFRKFNTECGLGQLDAWVKNGEQWVQHAHIILRYESVEQHLPLAVNQLRELIFSNFGKNALSDLTNETILQNVDAEFENRQKPSEIDYDSNTMITPEHRTFQPSPDKLTAIEKTLYKKVEINYRKWLVDHGYLNSNEHGQELEYLITDQLLKTFSSPIVIDVGVERGSFTQLAYKAGAAKIIGYEPLPRHFEYLTKKYAGAFEVNILPYAVSNENGTAQLHIATDPQGNELDFHHTLSDLGDSASVVRSVRSLEVKKITLADQAAQGVFPNDVHFLKIDTDGHDLSVLQGLGNLQPRVILAEYWDNLPETSGKNIYNLSDLAMWATTHGYKQMIVVRRHQRIELIELNAPWTLPGDWGNVFFFREDFNSEIIQSLIEIHAKSSYSKLCAYVHELVSECEAKEAEIQHLAASLRQHISLTSTAQPAVVNDSMAEEFQKNQTLISSLQAQLDKSTTAFQQLSHEAAQKDQQLLQKEEVIQTFSKIINKNISENISNNLEKINSLQIQLEKQKSVSKDTDFELAQSRQQLIEKEEVIQALAKSAMAYRLAYTAVRPFGWLLNPWRVFMRHIRAMLMPRLGNLNQYPPRKLTSTKFTRKILDKKSSPKISIVTPSFMQGNFIERTLRSVINQGYPNLEYFVQDGASSDKTVEVLTENINQITGFSSETDTGQSQAINRGLTKTNGEIMAWLNSDDLLLPGALHTVADYFNRHPEVDVVYGNRLLIDENDMEIGRWIMPGHSNAVLSWADYVPQETLFWRRRIWDKVGGHIDESFKFAMDWDLLIRFREAGAKFAHIPQFLGAFRIHPHQKTSNAINDIGHKEMDRIRARVLNRIPQHEEIRSAVFPYLIKHIIFDLFYRIKIKITK